MLAPLGSAAQTRLVEAMDTIATLLGDGRKRAGDGAACVLRPPRPGDIGWVIQRHGALYALEQHRPRLGE